MLGGPNQVIETILLPEPSLPAKGQVVRRWAKLRKQNAIRKGDLIRRGAK
jgi:hypothetical protein